MRLLKTHSHTFERLGYEATVRLLLFEGGAKPVNASVTVHVERA